MIFRELKRAAQMWIFMVDYGDDGRPLFAFIPNQRCNQDFNETILETLSMSEKALKMLLNISGNVNVALMWSAAKFKVRIWLVLFAQVINKHLWMNASINLEPLTEMSQHFGRTKCPHKKNVDI